MPFKMSRNDVTVDNRQVQVKNSSWLGWSTGTLRKGMFFTYKADNGQIMLARMMHRIKTDPLHKSVGCIVAQVVNNSFAFTMERWVNPDDVIETIPADRIAKEVFEYFERQSENN